MDALTSSNAEALLVICREFGGTNLGAKRFQIYENISKDLAMQARGAGGINFGGMSFGAVARGGLHNIGPRKVRANDLALNPDTSLLEDSTGLGENTAKAE